jgi:hypothetical protein
VSSVRALQAEKHAARVSDVTQQNQLLKKAVAIQHQRGIKAAAERDVQLQQVCARRTSFRARRTAPERSLLDKFGDVLSRQRAQTSQLHPVATSAKACAPHGGATNN